MWDKADVGPGSALSKLELGTEHSPIDNNREEYKMSCCIQQIGNKWILLNSELTADYLSLNPLNYKVQG
jgi:hypothetical protein